MKPVGIIPTRYAIWATRRGREVVFSYTEGFARQHRRARDRAVELLRHMLPKSMRITLVGATAVRISGRVPFKRFADMLASEFLIVGSVGEVTLREVLMASCIHAGTAAKAQAELKSRKR